MQRINTYILCMAAMVLTATSCIDYEEEELSPYCSITSFAVADITTTLYTQTSEGIDSSYTRTIGGRNIKFNIDQLKGTIESVDSLPEWVDLTKVIPSVNHLGTLFAKKDSVYVMIVSGRDSLDLSKPLDLMVVASDGISCRHYTAVIHHSTANADSMLWTKTDSTTIKGITGNHKLLTSNGRMHLFYQTSQGLCHASTADGKEWTTPQTATIPAINPHDIITYKDQFCTTLSGQILTSANGTEWATPTTQQADRLLMADQYYIYALSGESIISSANLTQWHKETTRNTTLLPESPLTGISYPTRTNPQLMVSIMIGKTKAERENATVWYKISSPNTTSNQQWANITITTENPYPLPAMENLTAFHYKGAIYATGDAFTTFHKSEDNGLTWHRQTKDQFPPQALQAATPLSTTVWDNNIWMLQANTEGTAQIWKGHTNK